MFAIVIVVVWLCLYCCMAARPKRTHPAFDIIKDIVSPLSEDDQVKVLKRNKYVGILSIAVTTLQYITISMITIFSMYIAHVR